MHTPTRPGLVVAAVLLPATAAACLLSRGGSAGEATPSPSGEADVSVTVRNENTSDARLYVLEENNLVLLGSVGSFASRTFRVPRRP